jgi:hypothetical protein
VAVYHMRDGRILEQWLYPQDPEGLDAFRWFAEGEHD